MAALNALRRTPGALQRNPVLLVPVLVVLLFQAPQYALRVIHPLLATVVSLLLSLLLSLVFVFPLFQAGIVGMADEALDGRTSLDTFLRKGWDHYLSVLAAYLGLVAVNFVVGVLGAVGGVVVLVFGSVLGGFFAVYSVAFYRTVGRQTSHEA